MNKQNAVCKCKSPWADLNPQLFRKAAAEIAGGYASFACVALNRVTLACSPFLYNRYQAFLAELYQPSGYVDGGYWRGKFAAGEPQGREVRILALLLAADVLESELKQ